jgi:hypothetical protein
MGVASASASAWSRRMRIDDAPFATWQADRVIARDVELTQAVGLDRVPDGRVALGFGLAVDLAGIWRRGIVNASVGGRARTRESRRIEFR